MLLVCDHWGMYMKDILCGILKFYCSYIGKCNQKHDFFVLVHVYLGVLLLYYIVLYTMHHVLSTV